MAENSAIEWTHHTFNPWWGCAKVSPGCDHCYAERDAGRFTPGKTLWGVDADRRTFGDKHWNEPKKWDAKAKLYGVRYRVFCASMADVFDKNAPAGARDRLWALIKATPNLDWLILTKRIGNAKSMLPADWGNGYSNVWLGASIVNQEEAHRDIPKLIDTPAAVRFLSMEPLLGPVDLTRYLDPTGISCMDVCPESRFVDTSAVETYKNGQSEIEPVCPHCGEGASWTGYDDGIDWVIVGGESGNKARPMHPQWVRSLRDQCAAASVPFLLKQWGEWLPGHHYTPELQERDSSLSQSRYLCAQLTPDERSVDWQIGHVLAGEIWDDGALWRVGKKSAGRLLDGVQHDGYPNGIENGGKQDSTNAIDDGNRANG